MLAKLSRVVVIGGAVFTSFVCSASDNSIKVSWGQGSSRYILAGDDQLKPETFRLSYARNQITQWDLKARHKLYLDGEVSFHQWNDPFLSEEIHGFSVLPLIRYDYPWAEWSLNTSVGIGVIYINEEQWMDRKLGAKWQFEDKIEVAMEYRDTHTFAISLIHYSNAQFSKPNHGVNVWYLSYGYSW